MPHKITIRHGLPENLRRDAAGIYYDAFRHKIGWLLGGRRKGVEFIERIFHPEFAICAIVEQFDGRDAQLVGIAGFKTAGGSLVSGTFGDVVAYYGPFSAIWRALFLSLLEREVEPGVLLMDGIAVATDQRGNGVGKLLIKAIVSHAKSAGFHRVRLDVVNSNPRAKALYERMGFTAFGEENIGLLKYIYGFSSVTKMLLEIENSKICDAQSQSGD